MAKQPSACCRGLQLDVVIGDLNLPGEISGIDILDALATIPRKIDGILVTGRGSDESCFSGRCLHGKASSTKRIGKDDPEESKEKLRQANGPGSGFQNGSSAVLRAVNRHAALVRGTFTALRRE